MSTYEAIRYNFTGASLTSLNGSNISSGTVAEARVANLDTAKITSGTFANARLSSGSVTQHVDLTALSASNLTSGTVPNARYGTPTFSGANLTNLPAGGMSHVSVTSGTWSMPSASDGNETTTSNSLGTPPSGAKGGIVTIQSTAYNNPQNIWIKTFTGTGVTAPSFNYSPIAGDQPYLSSKSFERHGYFSCGTSTVSMTVALKMRSGGGTNQNQSQSMNYICMWVG